MYFNKPPTFISDKFDLAYSSRERKAFSKSWKFLPSILLAVLVKQISSEWLADTSSLGQLKDGLIFIRNINGQEYWAISMGMSAISYVSVSLLGKSSSFNMDKLLNRGEYVVEGESKIINKDTQIGWKIFLMGEEFTKTDKIIYLLTIIFP